MVPAKWVVHQDGRDHEYTFEDDTGLTIMVPEFDPLKEDFVGRHTHDQPDTACIDYIKSFEIDQATFESANVVEMLQKELAQQTGEFFEESMHYKEEALKCYNAHGNPDIHNKCPDFQDDSKRIGRKVPPKYQMYLCAMCPYVQTQIAQEVRWKQGLYKPDRWSRRRGRRRAS
jgi:hypothetical protein